LAEILKNMIDKIIEALTDYKTYVAIYVLILGFLLKVLMDLNQGIFFIRNFYWISLRGIFRSKVDKISGVYRQYWDFTDNNSFTKKSERQSLITIKQLNNYCYGEFTSRNKTYYIFGEIINRRIIGHWADKKSKLGYFGSFQLTIINQERIEGFWIGHSNENPILINNHKWYFHSVNDTTRFLVLVQLSIFFKRMKQKYFS
jgi:hypothetical protein